MVLYIRIHYEKELDREGIEGTVCAALPVLLL